MELTRAQVMAVFSIAINHAPIDARFSLEKDGSSDSIFLRTDTGLVWSVAAGGQWRPLHAPVPAA